MNSRKFVKSVLCSTSHLICRPYFHIRTILGEKVGSPNPQSSIVCNYIYIYIYISIITNPKTAFFGSTILLQRNRSLFICSLCVWRRC